MTSNFLPLLFAVLCSAVLAGCQSNPKNSTLTANSILIEPVISQETVKAKAATAKKDIIVINTEIAEVASEAAAKTNTLEWASHYDWKLMQVKDKKNNPINTNTDTPITLAVAPSSLSLSQGCQHLAIKFVWMSEPPFKYGSRLGEKRSTCKNVSKDIKNETDIKALFPRDSTFKLGIESLPLSMNEPINTQNTARNLVVTIENSNTLIFISKPKAFKKPTGLPINKALLERYNWHLVSAVRNTFDDNGKIISRQVIRDFYYPNHPILLEFRSSPDNPYVAFNAGCNGSSATYFLLRDHTLKVDNILSSAMNCGKTGDRVETYLFDFMRNSSSKLSLSLQPSTPISTSAKSQSDMSRYNLLQTMSSGETLVWQNESKKTP